MKKLLEYCNTDLEKKKSHLLYIIKLANEDIYHSNNIDRNKARIKYCKRTLKRICDIQARRADA